MTLLNLAALVLTLAAQGSNGPQAKAPIARNVAELPSAPTKSEPKSTLDDWAKWGAIAQGASSVLLLFGGIWAWHRYREAKRTDSIKWLTETSSRFYQLDKLDDKARQQFEYDFDSLFAPVMEKWLVYPKDLTEEDKNTLTRVDALLNFFEIICYVSQEDRHLSSEDREATFQYWFDDVIASGDDHVFLRLYLMFGFENLRKRIQLELPRNLIAVYGTLTESAFAQLQDPKLRAGAEKARAHLGKPVGPCQIRGKLYDLGSYPGIVRDPSAVVPAELYELPFGDLGDEGLQKFREKIRAIDDFEGVDIRNPKRSEYSRRYVRLASPANTNAWVYFLNEPRGNPIESPTKLWSP